MNGDRENKIVVYTDDEGNMNVSVRFADEDVWLTQNQIAEIYDTTRQNIAQHIDGIYKNCELNLDSTCKKFLLVRTEGERQ